MEEKGYSNININELNVSDEFKQVSEKLGLKSVSDIMKSDIRLIKKHPDYSVLWYAELARVLKDLGLLNEFERKLL